MIGGTVRGYVLAGGSGKRFWPLSREMSPKQLLSIFGTESLVNDAVRRLAEIPGVDASAIAVLTNERLADELGNTLACSPDESVRRVQVLVEPLGRDSGPAVTLLASRAFAEDHDAIVAILPSNQAVSDADAWSRAARTGMDIARRGKIAHLCVELDGETLKTDVVFSRAEVLLDAVSSHPHGAVALDACAAIAALPPAAWTSDEVRDRFSAVDAFPLGEVMDAAGPLVEAFCLSGGIRDIADFRALSALSDADKAGNHRIGRGVDVDSHECIVHSTDRLVCTLGLRDTIIVDTSDATLVCAADRAGDVRLVADTLAELHEPEAVTPKVSLRPWGTWMSLVKGDGYQMKIIVVLPGKRLSLQSHVHRSEHWIVVEGAADVTLDEGVVHVEAGRSIYIPAGVRHRLENPGACDVKIVEVQVGSYLGEDDIVRYEDDYDRAR